MLRSTPVVTFTMYVYFFGASTLLLVRFEFTYNAKYGNSRIARVPRNRAVRFSRPTTRFQRRLERNATCSQRTRGKNGDFPRFYPPVACPSFNKIPEHLARRTINLNVRVRTVYVGTAGAINRRCIVRNRPREYCVASSDTSAGTSYNLRAYTTCHLRRYLQK